MPPGRKRQLTITSSGPQGKCMTVRKLVRGVVVSALVCVSLGAVAANSILNSSYDVARELFAAYNELFMAHWQEKTGETVTINQSHAGSSTQAQARSEERRVGQEGGTRCAQK